MVIKSGVYAKWNKIKGNPRRAHTYTGKEEIKQRDREVAWSENI
jgi:hypothetical protein